MKHRLAIVTTHPIQYQVPWFRHLAAQDWVEPHVFFGSRHGLESTVDREFGARFAWDIPMIEGYRHEFMENVAARPDVSAYDGVDTPAIGARLAEGRFHAVLVMGWHVRSFWQAFRGARRARVPLLLRGESNLLGPRPWWKRIARRVRLRPVLQQARAILAIGRLNREFYLAHGVEDGKIHEAPYFVDNARFASAISRRGEIRQRRGIAADDFVFLFCGKLVGRKRPMDLIEAWSLLPDECRQASRVILVGEGGLRPELEERVARLGHTGRVLFPGFVNQAELPEWYAAADALVMPSDFGETWGLSANEALAAGARLVLSDRCGGAPDLVVPGVTGDVFPCGDIHSLRGVLQRYVQDREWLQAGRQREALTRHAEAFRMERSTAALQEVIASAHE